MSPDKLVYMANQIATFFESRSHAEGAAGVAAHINAYWEPRMRSQLLAIVAAGGGGLKPLVLDAEAAIRRSAEAGPG